MNTVTPNFVAIFVFFGTASSFIERISSSETEAKREAILFFFGSEKIRGEGRSKNLYTSKLKGVGGGGGKGSQNIEPL